MKTIAKFLTGLTVALLLFVGYYVWSSSLPAEVSVRVEPASAYPEDFAAVQQMVQDGKLEGVSALDTIQAYYVVTIDVNVSNYSLFTGEWAQLQVRGVDGDLVLLSLDGGPKDIPSFGQNTFSARVFTRSAQEARGGWLEYYVFGRLHTIEISSAAADTAA
ncbi:MAG: hypothetical protein SOU13_09825 [Eubacteriales bacterium]|nr:hypothetical protein [Eubacteriales bacterium]